MAAGVGTYLYLLDPESYTVHEPFSWVGASLPTADVAALVHVVLTRLVVRPAGRGGYHEGARARPAREEPRPAEPAAAPEP
jgi:nucleobase:cation symporter-1, NCS1 family